MYNKLTKPFYIQTLSIIIFLTTAGTVGHGQDSIARPLVMSKWDDYVASVKQDPARKMTDLKQTIPHLVLDLRYATVNNFMKRKMYVPAPATTFLRAGAAEALLNVQKELVQSGLGLKIFDAYRPYSVTVKFWELVKDERYVANPAKGSGHNRGVAVDLTIIRLKDGSELPMGTGFDNFSDTAHHSFNHLPADVLQNRHLLKSLMEKYGFRALETEWWHYSLPDAGRFELLDVPFGRLKSLGGLLGLTGLTGLTHPRF